jgi:hypothetical protein
VVQNVVSFGAELEAGFSQGSLKYLLTASDAYGDRNIGSMGSEALVRVLHKTTWNYAIEGTTSSDVLPYRLRHAHVRNREHGGKLGRLAQPFRGPRGRFIARCNQSFMDSADQHRRTETDRLSFSEPISRNTARKRHRH